MENKRTLSIGGYCDVDCLGMSLCQVLGVARIPGIMASNRSMTHKSLIVRQLRLHPGVLHASKRHAFHSSSRMWQEEDSKGSGKSSESPSSSSRKQNYLQVASSSARELVDRHLFRNYPRTLRDLALRARRFARSKATDGAEDAEHKGHLHGRPTRDELLSMAKSFWTRMRIHFKWITIRGFRRFNIDDFSAFFTLGGLGTAIWVIVGTTTFVSVIFAALSLLNMQEWIALQLAKILSKQLGFTIVFGSAIVPKWKEGRISFKDVVITRRAEPTDPETLHKEHKAEDGHLMKGTSSTPTMRLGDAPSIPAYDTSDHIVSPLHQQESPSSGPKQDPHKNFSMFELHIDSIDVQLSLSRWLDGRGFLHKMDVRGIRGVIDRRHVFWDANRPYNPREARRKAKPNDIDLESFTVEDFLVTLYQPGDFRPFNVSIFDARIPRLRAQWLFYDLLNADSMTGQVDGCLFSLHKPQSVHHTTRSIYSKMGSHSAPYIQNWSRLRVDGVNIDHVQKMAGLSGPLMWIYSGRFDLVADIKFPKQYGEDVDINTIISEIRDNLNATFSGERVSSASSDDVLIPGQPELSGPAILAPVTAVGPAAERARQQRAVHDAVKLEEKRRELRRTKLLPNGLPRADQDQVGKSSTSLDEAAAEAASPSSVPTTSVSDADAYDETSDIRPSVVIELDVRFKDIKASMPIFTRELSYSTYALARPIVAFMNANKTLIPVDCRIIMDLSEFDGSLDLSQTGLPPLVSEKIWEALANHVASQQANHQRVRNVSLWSLNILSQGLLRLARHWRDTLARVTPPEVPAT